MLEHAFKTIHKALEYQAKRKWQGLTIEELQEISDSMSTWNNYWLVDVYYAIEAKLREKNGF